MTHFEKMFRVIIAALVGATCLFVGDKAFQNGSLTTEALAVIGRPATPMSYAGVARRTTRRAVAAPVVVAPAPVVVAPAGRCVQTVDAYGRVYTRCY